MWAKLIQTSFFPGSSSVCALRRSQPRMIGVTWRKYYWPQTSRRLLCHKFKCAPCVGKNWIAQICCRGDTLAPVLVQNWKRSPPWLAVPLLVEHAHRLLHLTLSGPLILPLDTDWDARPSRSRSSRRVSHRVHILGLGAPLRLSPPSHSSIHLKWTRASGNGNKGQTFQKLSFKHQTLVSYLWRWLHRCWRGLDGDRGKLGRSSLKSLTSPFAGHYLCVVLGKR